MSKQDSNTLVDQLFGLLIGDWQGTGKGEFPTINPFDYSETLRFVQRDPVTLFYEQRTDKKLIGQTEYVTSHWESGFLVAEAPNKIVLANAQSGGRTEVMIGDIVVSDGEVVLQLTSQSLNNDVRMVATTRTLTVSANCLHYQMQMHTNRVQKITHHLAAKLHRVGS